MDLLIGACRRLERRLDQLFCSVGKRFNQTLILDGIRAAGKFRETVLNS
jgi:hypothetical protein